jgi:hypothetical protein
MFPRRCIPPYTGDAEVSRLALEWLRTCKTDHVTCEIGQTQNARYYPKRLLNIMEVDSQICHLLVFEDERTLDDGDYVALSHC